MPIVTSLSDVCSFRSRRVRCLLDTMVSFIRLVFPFRLILNIVCQGTSIRPFNRCANPAKPIGSFPIRCFIVFTFSAISIHRSIHFAMHWPINNSKRHSHASSSWIFVVFDNANLETFDIVRSFVASSFALNCRS
jgi:hypothetical protein